jgi:hypothetical protein
MSVQYHIVAPSPPQKVPGIHLLMTVWIPEQFCSWQQILCYVCLCIKKGKAETAAAATATTTTTTTTTMVTLVVMTILIRIFKPLLGTCPRISCLHIMSHVLNFSNYV